jgi:hypothetical protein
LETINGIALSLLHHNHHLCPWYWYLLPW